MQLMGMGAKVTKVLGLKDLLTGASGGSSKAAAAIKGPIRRKIIIVFVSIKVLGAPVADAR